MTANYAKCWRAKRWLRHLGVVACLALCSVLVACSNNQAPSSAGGANGSSSQTAGATNLGGIPGSKILVVYFSHSGNTKQIAEYIAEETGGTLLRLTTEKTYSEDYDTVVQQAKEEKAAAARPKLSSAMPNLADYQVVFVGYPNWWGTAPMAVFSFLESGDFAGKRVVPFCTHGGSALGCSEQDIAKVIPKAQLLPGFEVPGSQVGQARDKVKQWLTGLDLGASQQ